jgi:uncharacterized protein
MSLVLIRGENQTKILNSLADMERYAKLKIQGKPRLLDPKKADKCAQTIIGTPLRTKSKIAVLVSVEQDATRSIVQIRGIHPPAHLMVISEEYSQWGEMKKIFGTLPPLKGYYSSKIKNTKK